MAFCHNIKKLGLYTFEKPQNPLNLVRYEYHFKLMKMGNDDDKNFISRR